MLGWSDPNRHRAVGDGSADISLRLISRESSRHKALARIRQSLPLCKVHHDCKPLISRTKRRCYRRQPPPWLVVNEASFIVAWRAEERYRTPSTAQAATTVDLSPRN
jgi:hypothetical protein